jgi:hypothetical protein
LCEVDVLDAKVRAFENAKAGAVENIARAEVFRMAPRVKKDEMTRPSYVRALRAGAVVAGAKLCG